uniref:Uncharacterized protein n=1 Tax=Spongospora subterranea TaxID=70186 RepID=A0A0H5R268_9EUKA|eukprot:CRZ08289.1 hypothetical protein [Spongospora subterranea]
MTLTMIVDEEKAEVGAGSPINLGDDPEASSVNYQNGKGSDGHRVRRPAGDVMETIAAPRLAGMRGNHLVRFLEELERYDFHFVDAGRSDTARDVVMMIEPEHLAVIAIDELDRDPGVVTGTELRNWIKQEFVRGLSTAVRTVQKDILSIKMSRTMVGKLSVLDLLARQEKVIKDEGYGNLFSSPEGVKNRVRGPSRFCNRRS